MKPLLLLDVDGVLNPSASRKWLDNSEFTKRNTTVSNGFTYPVWLNRKHGKQLLNLCDENGLDLVWCTTWEDEANEFIGPRLGLPQLPVIKFGFNGMTWKFGSVLDYAQDRPLAWLDDDFEMHRGYKEWFLDQRADIPTHLQQVLPKIGMTENDLAAIDRWAKELND